MHKSSSSFPGLNNMTFEQLLYAASIVCFARGVLLYTIALWMVKLMIEHVVDCLKHGLEGTQRAENKSAESGPTVSQCWV